MTASAPTETATFAGGCFWCIEEIFRQQPGVLKVVSGYTGGTVPNPTYAQVCSGDTGHAEAIQIVYDPQKIGFDKLLDVFWTAHDPTQLNRQGADVGTQYRSAIFTHSEAQQILARTALETENGSGRGLPPGILPPQQARALLPRRHPAQAEKTGPGRLKPNYEKRELRERGLESKRAHLRLSAVRHEMEDGVKWAVIPSLSRDLGHVLPVDRWGTAEIFRLRRYAPSLNMTAVLYPIADASSPNRPARCICFFR